MKAEDADIIRYRLSRAEEALEEAEMMLGINHLASAVSRLYHARFRAVWALLLTEGRASSKHSGVRSLFDQHWVNTGRLPAELGRCYRQLYERRQRSDYGDLATFEKAEVEELLAGAREVVKTISEKAREKMADESD